MNWITTIHSKPTFHYQLDLPCLLREAMYPMDYAGHPNGIKFATKGEYIEILQQLIQYFCPGDTMLGLFYAEKQKPGEHPRPFIEKKKWLANYLELSLFQLTDSIIMISPSSKQL